MSSTTEETVPSEEAIQSLDHGDRLRALEARWSGITDDVVAEFRELWRPGEDVESARSRWDLAEIKDRPDVWVPREIILWESEIFERALHRAVCRRLSMADPFRFNDTNLADMLLPPTNLLVSLDRALATRPGYPLPTSLRSGSQWLSPVAPAPDCDGDWYTLAMIEREWITRDREWKPSRVVSVHRGVVAAASAASIAADASPYRSDLTYRDWWDEPSVPLVLAPLPHGPVIGCDVRVDLLSSRSLLVASAGLAHRLGFTHLESPDFGWRDSNGDVVLRARYWRVRDRRRSADLPTLMGNDLIATEAVVERLRNATRAKIFELRGTHTRE